MLTENKFSKYLIYAIGEIVLVVIGILIALSINNWNERKKAKQFENTLFVELQKSIKNDILQLNDVIESKDYERLQHISSNLLQC